MLSRHSKCPKDPGCAAIKIVTLLQHDNVLITYCVLQVTGRECTERNKALGGDLPAGPSLQMACDDNLLVLCSEINNQAGCMDGYALVVCSDLRGIEVRDYLNSRWFVGPLRECAKTD